MWPFKRKANTYTEQVLNTAVQEATTTGSSEPIAAMTACVNLYGSRLPQCRVNGSDAITKRHLLDIGRDTVKYGHSRLLITSSPGGYKLVRPIRADKLSKGGWQITLRDGFSDKTLRVLDGEIVNFVFNPDPEYPWRGIPLWKSATARLAVGIDRVMGDEANAGAGKFLWIDYAPYGDEDARKKFARGLQALFGFVGKNRGKFTPLLNPAPHGKTQGNDIIRIGPDWPDSLEKTRAQLFKEICASCNVPPELILGGAAGTIREGNRQFVTTLQSVCDLLGMTLSESLEQPITISAQPLLKVDLVSRSRSRSVGSLTNAGVPVNQALEMCGFENG